MLPLIGLIPLLPLLGFVVNGLFGRRLPKKAVAAVACGSVLLALAVSIAAVAGLGSLPHGQYRQHPTEAGRTTLAQPYTSFEIRYWTWFPKIPFERTDPAGSAGAGADGEAASGGAPLEVDFGLRLDPLSAIMILIVTGVGFLIHVYSTGYMAHDPAYWRYFAYLNLFTAMMLTLVLAANFLVMFVGWEGVGLCSYLLIGFWYEDPEKAQAGRKAFITNRIGDFGFMLGMLGLLLLFHSLDFTTVMTAIGMGGGPVPVLTLIALALFVGACGKSAQIPLYVWLPDAMAGPTPVSALIHAATMVTAGVYMLSRCSVLFVHAPMALAAVAVVGAATALFAATVGLAQSDIKKVLAYSTVSQLGYMFLGAGVGAFTASIFHLMTHAFFKALLFLGAGSVIHAMSGEQDMHKMGGLRRAMPWTYRTMLAGALAIAGFPLLSGFFSKDEILWRAWATGHKGLWVIGAAAAALTAFYVFRLIYLTFHGEFRGTAEQQHHLHESPASMVAPLAILAVLAIAGGWIGIPPALGRFVNIPNYFEHYVEPVMAHLPGEDEGIGTAIAAARPLAEGASGSVEDAAAGPASYAASSQARRERSVDHSAAPGKAAGSVMLVSDTDGAAESGSGQDALETAGASGGHEDERTEYTLMAIAIAIALGGIVTARAFYRKPSGIPARIAAAAGPVYRLVYNKYWVDELYDAAVLRPYYKTCEILQAFDRWVLDGLVNAAGGFTELIGQVLRLFQTGFVRHYALLVFLGAVALVWFLER